MISASQVETVLQEEDIEGLLAIGSPKDEYISEAIQMAAKLNTLPFEQRTESNVSKVVMEVWEVMFGPFEAEDVSKRSPVLKSVVKKLMVYLKEH